MQTERKKVLRIFVSSPGDVAEERRAILEAIADFRKDPLRPRDLLIEEYAWEVPGVGVPLEATKTPQECINEGMPRPSECDVVFVVFASRMGTPLPATYRKPDGSPYWSGTEYEYYDALRGRERTGRPSGIYLFRCSPLAELSRNDPDYDAKSQQRHLVKAFFDRFCDTKGALTQSVNSYQNSQDFARIFPTFLKQIVKKVVDESHQAKPGRGLEVGECSHCRHVNLDWISERKRLCSQCGKRLKEPCVQCQTWNGIWNSFCGTCGVDLALSVAQLKASVMSALQQAQRHVQAKKFDQALEILQGVKVPDLTSFADQGLTLAACRHSAIDGQRDSLLLRLQQSLRDEGWTDIIVALEDLGKRLGLDSLPRSVREEVGQRLRKELQRFPGEPSLRRQYLHVRTTALVGEDYREGERIQGIVCSAGIFSCIVCCPLIVLLPLVLKWAKGLNLPKRWHDYGPLPRSCWLSSDGQTKKQLGLSKF